MNRPLILMLVLVCTGTALWFLHAGNSGVEAPSNSSFGTGTSTGQLPTNNSITQPKLAIDLYPLYTDAVWNKTASEHVVIGTTTYQGAAMTSAPIDAKMDPGKVFMPFTQYYDELLASHGWHVANELAAGGHTGGLVGYRNGPGTILVSFHIEYKTTPKDAPSECPCVVTFSLFSSGATD